jgi:hypothetical protein
MGKRSARQRLKRGPHGARPCGCNAFDGVLCVGHLLAMPPAERVAWRRINAARTGRTDPPPRDVA